MSLKKGTTWMATKSWFVYIKVIRCLKTLDLNGKPVSFQDDRKIFQLIHISFSLSRLRNLIFKTKQNISNFFRKFLNKISDFYLHTFFLQLYELRVTIPLKKKYLLKLSIIVFFRLWPNLFWSCMLLWREKPNRLPN